MLVSLTPDAQHGNLFVLHARRLRKPVDRQVGEVLTQDPRAEAQLRLRNDEHQHSSRFQPTVSVLQKNEFQPLIVGRASFQIIGRIEVEKREGLCGTSDIEGAPLQRLNAQIPSPFRSMCVYLNSVATRLHPLDEMSKCHSISHTRIERGELRIGSQAIP